MLRATSLKRRNFLKLLSSAGIASATFPLMRTATAETSQKRVIFIAIPDGMRPDDWHAQGTETDFTLPGMTQPLDRVKEDCIFLSGLDMKGSGSTHEGGVIKLLTGTEGNNSNIDVSLDYYLGDYFKNQTIKPHLNLNIVPIYHNKHMTFDFNGTAVSPEKNPLVAFESLFGGSSTESVQQQRRLSVLDNVTQEVNALMGNLGNDEKQKLETHLESIRELETRLQANTSSCPSWDFNPTNFSVTRTSLWDNPEYLDATQMELIGDLHTDVAIHALACDLTRVVTLKWNNSVNENVMPGSTMTGHGASHAGGQAFIDIKAWYVERFAQLIEKLKNYPDGDGTLLDNTLIFMGSELAHGNWHNHEDMPFILAGGSAGGMVTGRSLQFDSVPHNKLLVSIAQFMDVDISSFGTQDPSPSTLPGLLG
ncbi:MAG: DUF1552 domain-containing protein [Thiotrichaceae bacterium]